MVPEESHMESRRKPARPAAGVPRARIDLDTVHSILSMPLSSALPNSPSNNPCMMM